MSVKSTEDDFVPGNWEGDKNPREGSSEAPPVGYYIWFARIMSADYFDLKTDKPYVTMKLTVEEIETRPSKYAGFTFELRQYFSQACEGWARYFLRKFGYPEELLEKKNPTVKRSVLVQLTGEILVEVSVNQSSGFLKFDARGYQRVGETDLEPRLAKFQGEEGGEREPGEDTPAVDIHADDTGATPTSDELNELDGME